MPRSDYWRVSPPPLTEAVWAEVSFFMVVLCLDLVAYSVSGFSAWPVRNRLVSVADVKLLRFGAGINHMKVDKCRFVLLFSRLMITLQR